MLQKIIHISRTSSWVRQDEMSRETDYGVSMVSLGAVVCCLILIELVIYLIDFQYHGKHLLSKLSQIRRHQANASVIPPNFQSKYFCFSIEFWKAAWNTLLKRVSKPSPRYLHDLTVINLILTLLYVLLFLLIYVPGEISFLDRRWIYCLFQTLYAITRFVLSSFYIIRFQVTLEELNEGSVYTALFLWIVNSIGLCFNLLSVFNSPPYLQLISDDVGITATVIFAFCDASLNSTILFLFIMPISRHIHNLKFQLTQRQKEGKRNSQEHSQSQANYNTLQKHLETSAELKRIRSLQRVVRRAAFTCAVAVSFTLLDNILYCFAYYIDANMEFEEGRFSSLAVAYGWVVLVEAASCSFLPLVNYRRFQRMWCSCRSSAPNESTGAGLSKSNPMKPTRTNPSASHHTQGTVNKRPGEGISSPSVQVNSNVQGHSTDHNLVEIPVPSVFSPTHQRSNEETRETRLISAPAGPSLEFEPKVEMKESAHLS
jgi:hypothetical protein